MKKLNCGLLSNSYVYFTEQELLKTEETIKKLTNKHNEIIFYYFSNDHFVNVCIKIIEKEKNSLVRLKKINQEELFNKIDFLLLYEKPYSKKLHSFIFNNPINVCD